MLWIGLTGGLASGKTSVANILRKKNISVVCADTLARSAVDKGTEGLRLVVSSFGKDLLTQTGQLDRQKLATKVFSQRSSLLKLEEIIHPIVRKLASEAREQLKREGKALAFYDVPLLFEKKMADLFDKVVVVNCSEAKQLERAILRDHSNETQVRQRLANQMPLDEKVKLADFVIENNEGLGQLEKAVEQMLVALR